MMLSLFNTSDDAIRASNVELISNCITHIGMKLTDELRLGIQDFVANIPIAAVTVRKMGKKAGKKLSEEQLREREAKKAEKAEEKAKKAVAKAEEKTKKAAAKAEAKAKKAEEKAAKKAATGGWTTKEIQDTDGNIMKGINKSSLRVAKKKSAPRGEWPKDQIQMKVSDNWTDEGKARFKELYGEPLDISSEKKQSDTSSMPDMTALLAAAAEPVAETAAEPVAETAAEPVAETATEPVTTETKTDTPVIVTKSKTSAAEKKAAKKAALDEKKKAIAEKKKVAAEKKAAAEKAAEAEKKAQAEKAADEETKAAAVAEAELAEIALCEKAELCSEDEDDAPTEWTHDSYDGDDTIFKDEDGGVYRYDEETEDYELIGFYDEDADELNFD